MNEGMKKAIVEESVSELHSLLLEHIDCIAESMQSALAEHHGEAQFSYPVSLGLKLTPYSRDQSKVVAKISYSVKHSDETDGRMVDPNQTKFAFAGKDENGTQIIDVKLAVE